MITIYGTHLPRPGTLDAKCTLGCTLEFLALVIDEAGLNTKEKVLSLSRVLMP